jgi:uncharacterized membrane protein
MHMPSPASREGSTTLHRVLAGAVLAFGSAALIVMLLTWPPSTAATSDAAGLGGGDVEHVSAVVDTIERTTCDGTVEDQGADGAVPDHVDCTQVTATVTGADHGGRQVTVWVPSSTDPTTIRTGTRIVLEHYPSADGAAESWAWSDFRRSFPLSALGLAFVLVAAAVGGWRGVRALLGLAVAFVTIWVYLLPSLIAGDQPGLATLAASVAIIVAVGFLTHGFTPATTTALLGTFAGIGIVALTSVIMSSAAHLNPVATEDDYYLAQLLGEGGVVRLHAVFLAGVVLAALGILNDVTITQSSAVHELRLANPTASFGSLFTGGMRIGRDHMASMIYTLAFAYTGTALPVLMLLQMYELPLAQTLQGGIFAEELVRSGAGALGLVLSVPATTAVAALVESQVQQRGTRPRRARTLAPTPVEG